MEPGRYDGPVDLGDSASAYSKLAQHVAPGDRVLDVGCATGNLALALAVERNCSVVGVEVDAEAAAAARRKGLDARQGDIAATPLRQLVGESLFDIVVFADVLEHLLEPAKVLSQIPGLLKTGGKALVSVPNITHIDTLVMLAQDTWQYRDTGLLDESHIRFFSLASFTEMASACGLEVVSADSVTVPPLGTELLESGKACKLSKPDVAALSRIVEKHNANAQVYQHVLLLAPNSVIHKAFANAASPIRHQNELAASDSEYLASLRSHTRERAVLRRRVTILEADLEDTRRELESLLRSRSWRATGPLRRCAQLVRGVRGERPRETTSPGDDG